MLARLCVRKQDLSGIDAEHRPEFRTKLELAVDLLRWAKSRLGPLGEPPAEGRGAADGSRCGAFNWPFTTAAGTASARRCSSDSNPRRTASTHNRACFPSQHSILPTYAHNTIGSGNVKDGRERPGTAIAHLRKALELHRDRHPRTHRTQKDGSRRLGCAALATFVLDHALSRRCRHAVPSTRLRVCGMPDSAARVAVASTQSLDLEKDVPRMELVLTRVLDRDRPRI